MSSCTVAQLAGVEFLRLRVLVEGDLERSIRSVHVSDLERPARYVLPGGLLLTNGLWLKRIDPTQWARQAHGAGAAAIGYGVGETGPATPDALVQACRRLELPLLEVPEDLPFSLIGECVMERNRNPDATVRLQLTRLRRLLQDLARGEGHDAVLDLVRRETRLAVWLVGPGGRMLAGGDLPPRISRAAARAARRGDLPCAVGPRMSAFGIADALLPMAFIVGAALADVTDDARLVLEQAAAYVVIEDARWVERETIRSRMADEMLTLLNDGELGERALRRRLEALGLVPEGALTVIASSNAAQDLVYAALGCGTTCVLTPHSPSSVLLIQSDDEAIVHEVADLIRDGDADPVIGAARASNGSVGLRRALAEALSAHQLALTQPTGERVVPGLVVASHRQLLDFVDPDVLRAFRECVLGAVERWDEEHGSQLLATLAAFFANDGHWRRTAAQLHIHHNTLHYRLDKVARLTGRSVDSTADRVDFKLALAVGAAETSAARRRAAQLRAVPGKAAPRR